MYVCVCVYVCMYVCVCRYVLCMYVCMYLGVSVCTYVRTCVCMYICMYICMYVCMLEKISWTDHGRNEDVLLRVNEQRNILHEIRKRKANWIDHILRRNCLLKQVIEGKIKGEIEVARRRGRRRKKLLDDLKDRR